MGSKCRFVPLSTRIRGLVRDSHELEALIQRGELLVDGMPVRSPRAIVPAESSVVIATPKELRGREKLASALRDLRVDAADAVALDAGAAAGGFTQALLEAGVRRVYAVDVGFGQLRGSLRQDPRVVVLERTNVAELDERRIDTPVDVIAMDLSYLPVASAVDQLRDVPKAHSAQLVALIKPMFELGLPQLPAEGRLGEAVLRAVNGVTAAGWDVVRVVESRILGSHGAVEFFLHARRSARSDPGSGRPPVSA